MEELKNPIDFCTDEPDKMDYLFDEYLNEERSEGTQRVRPEEYYKVLDQKTTPMCTLFGTYATINANNILEDIINEGQIVREQTNPYLIPVDTIRNTKTRIDNAKNEGLIEGYLSIPLVGTKTPTGVMTKERRLFEIKTALEQGYFIVTGTYGVKRTHGMSPLLKITNDYNTGHAFALTGTGYTYQSTGNLIRMINSFGKERGDAGYGYIKEDDIDKLHTCYVIIDKSDAEFFRKFKANRKVMEAIQKFKEIYAEAVNSKNIEAIKYFDQIQLSKSLTRIYKL